MCNSLLSLYMDKIKIYLALKAHGINVVELNDLKHNDLDYFFV